MIGVHAYGIDHSYKKLGKTQSKCLVCGEYSECQILEYEEARHIFYIKIKILDEKLIFDWVKCNHRAVLSDKQDIVRYKLEQMETDSLSVPYYKNTRVQAMEIPKKVSTINTILVVLLGLALGSLLIYMQEFFKIPIFP